MLPVRPRKFSRSRDSSKTMSTRYCARRVVWSTREFFIFYSASSLSSKHLFFFFHSNNNNSSGVISIIVRNTAQTLSNPQLIFIATCCVRINTYRLRIKINSNLFLHDGNVLFMNVDAALEVTAGVSTHSRKFIKKKKNL